MSERERGLALGSCRVFGSLAVEGAGLSARRFPETYALDLLFSPDSESADVPTFSLDSCSSDRKISVTLIFSFAEHSNTFTLQKQPSVYTPTGRLVHFFANFTRMSNFIIYGPIRSGRCFINEMSKLPSLTFNKRLPFVIHHPDLHKLRKYTTGFFYRTSIIRKIREDGRFQSRFTP